MKVLSLLNSRPWRRAALLLVGISFALRTLQVIAAESAEPDNFGGDLVHPRVLHTATRLLDGRVLLVSGLEGEEFLVSCEVYTPATNSWTATGNLTPARFEHRSLLLNDGRVMTMGGYAMTTGILSSTVFYNPSTGIWANGPEMLLGRYDFDPILLPNGKVLVSGGITVAASAGKTAECELYDPIANTWTTTGSLLQPRADHHATLLTDGRVLVAGGRDESGALIATTEIYDPATGAWTSSGPLNLPRTSNVQLRLTNGRVLIAGGSILGPKGELPTHRAELFNPETGTWTFTGSMHTKRRNFSANLLNDRRVAATGGTASRRQPAHAVASIEVFDPVSGQWSLPTETLASPRYAHTATTLSDGSIIIAGGLDFNTLLPSAELFVTPR